MSSLKTVPENVFVIVQKGTYLKACKITPSRTFKFGKQGEAQITIQFDEVFKHSYGTPFKLVKATNSKVCTLEKYNGLTSSFNLDAESGCDNRDITDDGLNQKLSKEEILQLVDSGASGNEVIQTLAENNKSFKDKTKYSQEKYVSKKQKKYDEVVTILRPSIRLITKMYYSQDPLKILNLRIDTLSQLLCYSNVQNGATCAVFEAGLQGLVTSAMMHRIDKGGHLVHVFAGQTPHRDAIDMMNFSHGVLKSLSFIHCESLPIQNTNTAGANLFVAEHSNVNFDGADNDPSDGDKSKSTRFIRSKAADHHISSQMLLQGVHSLVIASRSHPLNVTLALLPYLQTGHNFVVFSPYKEVLIELFRELKQSREYVNLRICESWLREYQVLPERTHPHVSMSGGGGYLLTGCKVMAD